MCEIVGGSFFAKRKGCGIFWLIMFTIFLPLVIIFVGNVLVGGFFFYSFEYLSKKHCCKPINSFIDKTFTYFPSDNCLFKILYIIRRILVTLLYVIIFLVFLAITLCLGTAFGVILIAPSYIIYVIVLCRVKMYWRKRKTTSKITASKFNDLESPL